MYEIYCKLRDSRGLKDADVVKATGITKSTFSDWKSGRSNPKNDKLTKIADFLGVSVEYLRTGEEPEAYYFNEETKNNVLIEKWSVRVPKAILAGGEEQYW